MNAGSVSQWAARRQVDAMFARRFRTVEDAIAARLAGRGRK
jgi:hypothetical protein